MFQKEDGTMVDYSKIFRLLGEWFDAEMYQLLQSSPYKAGALMMGCPVWGEKHIDTFGRYCLPSMLAPGNLVALKDNATVVVFTRRQDLTLLATVKWHLQKAGINYLVYLIPDEVMEEAAKDGNGLYWILGVVHQLILKMAGWHGAGFHMLLPDHVFCESYFSNLLRLARVQEAICQNSVSATMDACPNLEKHRVGSGLAIPAKTLGEYGWTFLHPQMHPMIMNGKNLETDLPMTTTWWAWRAKDNLSMYSVHMNAMYLSPRLCLQAAPRLPATLDTELPHFIPGGFYVPKASDGMAFIELSDPNKRADANPIPWKRFSELFWVRVKFKDLYLPFAQSRGELPLVPDGDGLETEEIERLNTQIIERLKADKGLAAISRIEESNP